MDEREQEEEGQTRPLRKIQSYIPGFIGYGSKEHIRDADRMMRIQIQQKISLARRDLLEAKIALVEGGNRSEIDEIESISNSLRRVDGEIAYAEMGYTGLGSEFIRIETEELYEYDVELLNHIGVLIRIAGDIKSSAKAAEIADLRKQMSDFKAELAFVEAFFMKRMQIICH